MVRRRVLVLTHADDIDGLGSAVLIRMRYGARLKDILFWNYVPKRLAPLSKYIEKASQGALIDLFLTDLGPNDSTISEMAAMIKKVKAAGGRVFWMDHHIWNKNALDQLASLCDIAIVGENSFSCATEIVFKALGQEDPFERRFVEIVHYSDFNLEAKSKYMHNMIKMYALAINHYSSMNAMGRSFSGLRHIVGVVSRKKLYDRKMQDTARSAEVTTEKRVRRMLKDMHLVNENIAIGFESNIKSTYACMRLMEATKRDIGIFVNLAKGDMEGKVSLRSEKADISRIARFIGGGGHVHAAGCQVNPKEFGHFKTREGKDRFARYIKGACRRLGI